LLKLFSVGTVNGPIVHQDYHCIFCAFEGNIKHPTRVVHYISTTKLNYIYELESRYVGKTGCCQMTGKGSKLTSTKKKMWARDSSVQKQTGEQHWSGSLCVSSLQTNIIILFYQA
jgi:hypothetical protein